MREPRWWPKASCGKSLGADLPLLGEPSQRPGTGETAKHKQTLHSENQYHRSTKIERQIVWFIRTLKVTISERRQQTKLTHSPARPGATMKRSKVGFFLYIKRLETLTFNLEHWARVRANPFWVYYYKAQILYLFHDNIFSITE